VVCGSLHDPLRTAPLALLLPHPTLSRVSGSAAMLASPTVWEAKLSQSCPESWSSTKNDCMRQRQKLEWLQRSRFGSCEKAQGRVGSPPCSDRPSAMRRPNRPATAFPTVHVLNLSGALKLKRVWEGLQAYAAAPGTELFCPDPGEDAPHAGHTYSIVEARPSPLTPIRFVWSDRLGPLHSAGIT